MAIVLVNEYESLFKVWRLVTCWNLTKIKNQCSVTEMESFTTGIGSKSKPCTKFFRF